MTFETDSQNSVRRLSEARTLGLDALVDVEVNLGSSHLLHALLHENDGKYIIQGMERCKPFLREDLRTSGRGCFQQPAHESALGGRIDWYPLCFRQ